MWMKNKELIIEADCLGKNTPVFLLYNIEHFCDPIRRVFPTTTNSLTFQGHQLGVPQFNSVLT